MDVDVIAEDMTASIDAMIARVEGLKQKVSSKMPRCFTADIEAEMVLM